MTDPKESDEEILEVMRDLEPTRLSTAEIAEHLSIAQRQTNNRLNQLKGDEVKVESIGNMVMWSLSEQEQSQNLDPRAAPWYRRADYLRNVALSAGIVGGVAFVFGALFVFVSLTAAIQNASIPFVQPNRLLVVGYAFLAAGGGAIMVGGGSHLASTVMLKATKRKFSG